MVVTVQFGVIKRGVSSAFIIRKSAEHCSRSSSVDMF